jgi:hypothetical protein
VQQDLLPNDQSSPLACVKAQSCLCEITKKSGAKAFLNFKKV